MAEFRLRMLAASTRWIFFLPIASLAAELRVSTDFEGGSARVEAIDAETRVIRVMPGGDPQKGWPCWWYLRVDGLGKDETATIDLRPNDRAARDNGRDTGKPLPANWAMPVRAAVSYDEGRKWMQTAPGRREQGRIRYEVTGTGNPLLVAWGPPFTPRDTEALLSEAAAKGKAIEGVELVRTRENRPVRALLIADGPDLPQRRGVWVQARQHAWESGSSWVARGFVEWVISDEPDAAWLRRHHEIIVVPIMDVDNVVTGNGGKEEIPHDHNRDWSDQPVFPEVRAAQAQIGAWAKAGRLAAFLDLHNPGASDLRPFFYVGPEETLSQAGLRNRSAFLACAARYLTGPLALDEKTRETGPKYHPLWQQISSQWVNSKADPAALAICLETPWNSPQSTTENYRAIGKQLGQALAEYIRGLPGG